MSSNSTLTSESSKSTLTSESSNPTPQASKPLTLEEQTKARLAYLHNNDKINGREPPVKGAKNGSKNAGHGENQQAGKFASLGNFVTSIAGALS